MNNSMLFQNFYNSNILQVSIHLHWHRLELCWFLFWTWVFCLMSKMPLLQGRHGTMRRSWGLTKKFPPKAGPFAIKMQDTKTLLAMLKKPAIDFFIPPTPLSFNPLVDDMTKNGRDYVVQGQLNLIYIPLSKLTPSSRRNVTILFDRKISWVIYEHWKTTKINGKLTRSLPYFPFCFFLFFSLLF